jgi:integrase
MMTHLAGVAQLVEHHLAKVRVAGSSPVARSFRKCRSGAVSTSAIKTSAAFCCPSPLATCPSFPLQITTLAADFRHVRGSLRQRGRNSWELRVYAGTDPETGRRRWLTRTVRGSRTQAQRELVSLAALANVAPVVGARTSVAELLERWFAVNESNWAATTVKSTRSIIDRQLISGLGHVRVRELTTVMIDEFYASLRAHGRQDDKPLSPGSVRRVHGVLHRALAQAMRWEWIWTNPAAFASPPRVEPPEMRPPSPEDVTRLLEHVALCRPLFHLFLVLAATTGARRGQLLALRLHDINFDHSSLSFQRALVEGPEGPVLAPTKTRRSHRVALDAATLRLLRARFDEMGANCPDVLEDAFVFSNDPLGLRPWKPNWVTKQFIAARQSAGLDHFRLHDLRHFMATQMLAAGVAVPVVSARLAHARASTTLNVYAHAIPGGDVRAAKLISEIVGSPQGSGRLRVVRS